ncbi:MAG: 2-amino-4-hydroxy-6-hydroxymethyldihydropteridine diphosphokinase [Nodosilinea sp. LVE1205-7]|jgi:2-amino-4-hydroxy-6-hydroxymethyldihydropteridine diphosphokinase
MGDSRATLEAALVRLGNSPGVTVIGRSSLYKTHPLGGPEQPDYLNACAIIKVEICPQQLLTILMGIEQEFSRVRTVRWGPRTLDLDILLYADMTIDTATLKIPHPRMVERAFVLVPLAEIAPDWVHPPSGQTIAALVEKLNPSGIEILAPGARGLN